MDILDKIIMQEANSVTPDDYEKLTGTSLKDSMVRMKQHMAETKAKVAKAKKAEGNVLKMDFARMEMRYSMPIAASAESEEVKES